MLPYLDVFIAFPPVLWKKSNTSVTLAKRNIYFCFKNENAHHNSVKISPFFQKLKFRKFQNKTEKCEFFYKRQVKAVDKCLAKLVLKSKGHLIYYIILFCA